MSLMSGTVVGFYCQKLWWFSNARISDGGSLMPGTMVGFYCQEQWWVSNVRNSGMSLMPGTELLSGTEGWVSNNYSVNIFKSKIDLSTSEGRDTRKQMS